MSRPARGAWVEIRDFERKQKREDKSRPARGAWVEIDQLRDDLIKQFVAPRKGRVG